MLEYEVKLFPAMLGIVVNLDDVPDAVFADRMVGDGIAIDPFTNIVYAPLNGVVKSIHKAKYAITINSEYGFDILIHIGLDTVNLLGKGFTPLVKEGDLVRVNDKIMELDLDYLSLHAKTLISPILILDINDKNIKLEQVMQEHAITSLDKAVFLIKKFSDINTETDAINNNTIMISSKLIRIINQTGIHARPAALLAKHARELSGEIYIEKSGHRANLKSVTAILELSIQFGDNVKLITNDLKHQDVIKTIMTILSGLCESNETILTTNKLNLPTNDNDLLNANIYHGIIASSGLVIGKLVKAQKISFEFSDFCDDVNSEKQKLNSAIKNVYDELTTLIIDAKNNKEHESILTAHLMVLTDPEILDEIIKLIENKQSAPRALINIIDMHCRALENTGVELLKQRQIDLKDICNQILKNINGIKPNVNYFELDTILLAEELTPSDILNLDKNIIGLVSIKGGITSHVAILAKSKNIPLLINVNSSLLDNITNRVDAILDCNIGVLKLSPNENELIAINQEIKHNKIKRENALKNAFLPCVTLDNIQISCYSNISTHEEVYHALNNGADGVGLFRTEFLFLEQSSAPTIDMQLDVYKKIADELGNKPFILRTLDAGGEKNVPYLNMEHELNPVLGMRGIRLCLDNLELFKTQLKAILLTKSDNLKIMLPMISSINEYRKTKSLIKQLQLELDITKTVELGIMVEVPSVAIMTDIFAQEVDFFSIGTNDLTQYTLAIDRENTKLAVFLDHLNPAVLRNIKLVSDGAKKYNRPVSVCGMMASEKIALPVLIGLGILHLSMDINIIAENKEFIRKLNIQQCEEVAYQCLYLASSEEVRALLAEKFDDLIMEAK